MIGGSSRITLILTLQDATAAAAVYEGAQMAKPLPAIERMSCR